MNHLELEAMPELEAVIAQHRFIREGSWYRRNLVCACGFSCPDNHSGIRRRLGHWLDVCLDNLYDSLPANLHTETFDEDTLD